jgi:hypothetical protein
MFGLSRQQVAFVGGAVVIAIAAFATATVYSLPLTATIVLGIISIISSSFAGLIISRDQLQKELEQRAADKLRHVTSMAANELSNVYQYTSQLERTWDFISETMQIDHTARRGISDSLANIQLGIQNSIQSVISMGPGGDNPFGLYRFASEVECQIFGCSGKISAKVLPPYPRSSANSLCPVCRTQVTLRRRPDGSIIVKNYKSTIERIANQEQDYFSETTAAGSKAPAYVQFRSSNEQKKAKLIPYDIKCPSCNIDLHILVSEYYSYAHRGCPECGTVFTFDVPSRAAQLRKTNFNKTLDEKDLVTVDGALKAICGCGKLLGTKHVSVNRKGEAYLNCFYCGSLLFDRDHILNSKTGTL